MVGKGTNTSRHDVFMSDVAQKATLTVLTDSLLWKASQLRGQTSPKNCKSMSRLEKDTKAHLCFS